MMRRTVSLNVDDLFEWWDDARDAAILRAQLHGRRQTVFAANGLWAVQEVGS